MCVLEYIFNNKNKIVNIIKDNKYVLDFLKHVAKFSENDLDDRLIDLVRILLDERSSSSSSSD